MLKVVEFLVEVGFWIRAFASPFLLFAVGAGLVYISDENLGWLAILILIIGAIVGIVFAEWVRRKHGCSSYFGRLIGRSDIDEANNNNEK